MKKRDENDLLPGQSQALLLLATETRLDKVAEKLEISRQTLWNWIHSDSHFKLRLSQVDAELIATGTRKWVQMYVQSADVIKFKSDTVSDLNIQAVQMYVQSADVIKRAMDGEKVSVRQLRAADIVSKRLPDLLQMTALNVRLAELERQLLGHSLE